MCQSCILAENDIGLPDKWAYWFVSLVFKMEAFAERQIEIISDFFGGDAGRTNYDRLVLFAAKKVALGRSFSRRHAQDPRDYVNEAIGRCLPDSSGICRRSLDKSAPVAALLRRIVVSLISHDLFPKGARRSSHGEFDYKEVDGEPVESSADDFSTSMWADGATADLGRSLDCAQVAKSFVEYVRQDDEVHRIVKLSVEQNIEEPADLVARMVGLKVEEVYVAKKRLQRLFCRFVEEEKNNELKRPQK